MANKLSLICPIKHHNYQYKDWKLLEISILTIDQHCVLTKRIKTVLGSPGLRFGQPTKIVRGLLTAMMMTIKF